MRRRWSAARAMTLVQVVALLILIHPSAEGQDPSQPVQGGARIRLTGLNALRTTGAYLGGTRDSLWVLTSSAAGPDTVGFAREDLRRLERSLGFRSRAGRGAGIGALIGVGTGAVLGALAGAGSDCSDEDWLCFEITPAQGALAAGVFLGATGAVVGLIAGALTRHEDFEDVPAFGLNRIRVFPSGDRSVNVGLRFRFGRAGR